ncbi:MAG: type II toxin-antitoxin system RelE/ParE family toxin [Rhodanobacteraceae bacterium]
MRLQWADHALNDLIRLYEFLVPVNPSAAGHATRALARTPGALLVNPRVGQRLRQFDPLEVRRLVVEQYELRYEIRTDVVYVLRVWHTRENR